MKTILYPQIKKIYAALPALKHALTGNALYLWDAYQIKTIEEMQTAIESLVILLYNRQMTQQEFTGRLSAVVDTQLIEAWHAGMWENGFTPEEMLPEWAEQLEGILNNQQRFILGYAMDINEGRVNETPIDGFLMRAGLWAKRYTETHNAAILATSNRTDKLQWIFDPQKEHCTECEALDGIVAYSWEWERANVRPQAAPNERLGCGGWQCGCKLETTDKRRTANALDKIMRSIL